MEMKKFRRLNLDYGLLDYQPGLSGRLLLVPEGVLLVRGFIAPGRSLGLLSHGLRSRSCVLIVAENGERRSGLEMGK